MTVVQRLEQLEKRNKRLTVALTMTVVAMAAVGTVAATGLKKANFDEVTARRVYVDNDPGDVVFALTALPEGSGGDGLVSAFPEDCNRCARYIEGCRPFVLRYNAYRSNLDRKTELLSLRRHSG